VSVPCWHVLQARGNMTLIRSAVATQANLSELYPRSRIIQKQCIHAAMNSSKSQMICVPQHIARRRFGVEIEAIVTKTHIHQVYADILRSLNIGADASSWSVVEDKSIESDVRLSERRNMRCELISPILHFDYPTLSTLESICDTLQHRVGANINESCGFHIHFDAADLSLRDIIKISINYANFESVIDSFLHRSRRGDRNPYIRSLVHAITNNLDDLREILETEEDHFYDKSSLSVLNMLNPNRSSPRKFFKWNMSNSFYFNLSRSGLNQNKECDAINTIENRHHHGTVDVEDMINFVMFNLEFIHRSKTQPVILETHNSVEALADFIGNDDVINFYRRKSKCPQLLS